MNIPKSDQIMQTPRRIGRVLEQVFTR